MKHQWTGGMTPSTPDYPPEGYCYCENCGLEQTDTERDDTDCPYDHEAFETAHDRQRAKMHLRLFSEIPPSASAIEAKFTVRP